MEGSTLGQVLHGSVTTTAAVRRAIQHSQNSLIALSQRYDINPKTVAKWRSRETVEDRKTGPSQPRSTILSKEEEAIIITFRRHTLLPLDDCLYALQPTPPHLTRSSLHRCLQRHGISCLPDVDKPAKKTFKRYPIGYIHIDPCLHEGRLCRGACRRGTLAFLVAIDRTSKFTYVEVHQRAGKMIAAQFLRNVIKALPCKIHTMLTDNGIQFTNRKQDTSAFEPIFDRVCRENKIEHRLTRINHPWTNGQVERMNRTIRDATVKRYYYDNHEQLRRHLQDFIDAYNYARRVKTLKGLTPYEYIREI